MQRRIGMIWAEDKNHVIGSGSDMLWHVPADFAHFKATTMGHPVLMGRASWQALGAKALPGRRNIVITRQKDFQAPNAQVAHSLDQALELCDGESLVWITGGAQIYRQALPLADFLVVSELDLEVPNDTALVYAPVIDPGDWKLNAAESDTHWRPKSGDARWRVRVYERSQFTH